jgi:GntR family transcriptional regulator/MocR family aminotransferase
MAIEWSTSAAPVLFELRRDGDVPLGMQLERQLREAIQTGRLGAGERIPSTRALATQLGISRGLVQDSYAQLTAEGYLVAQIGSSTRIASLPHVGRQEAAARLIAGSQPNAAAVRVAFSSGVPDLATVPRQDWAWALREACRVLPNALFDYGEVAGDPELRTVLAGYLRRVRAADARPSDIVVCAGFAQGLALVADALVGAGIRRIAHEDPGSGGTMRAAAGAAGGEAVPVPVDDQGIDVDALEASGARAVMITPAHQWPTGTVLSPERRHRLIEWAERADGIIIEDEYDAEFRYDREPIGSLQGLAPERVVSLGTVSKSLAPGLRLGWAVVPTRLLAAVVAAKAVADRGNPALDQRALALLMSSGRYDRHLRRMRAEYARRREVLIAALAEWTPGLRVSGLAAGFHAVVHLPQGTDEVALVERARRHGLGLSPMSRFSATADASHPRLVLGFGNTPPESIEQGIEMLAAVLSEESRTLSPSGRL